MKRDMDLIRSILLKLEAFEAEPGSRWSFDNYDTAPWVEGWTPQEIEYNFDLMLKGGLLVSDGTTGVRRGQLYYSGMTWEGHDFLDAVRSPEIWRQTKGAAEKVGSYTFDVLKELAVELVKATAKHIMPGLMA